MSTSDPNGLGAVIVDPTARKVIYGTYTLVAFVAAALTVGLAAAGSVPQWDVVANAVISFVGAGVGGLAVANVQPKAAAATDDPVE